MCDYDKRIGLFGIDADSPELQALVSRIRTGWESGNDFQASVSEDCTQWVVEDVSRLPESDAPPFLFDLHERDSHRHWSRKHLFPSWLHLRVLAPREGRSGLAIIGHHPGCVAPGAGRKAADALVSALYSGLGESFGTVRISLGEDRASAWSVSGTTPPFATLLRYHDQAMAEKASRFWECPSGACASFLWYPSAGSDTRPLAWFLSREDEEPLAKVDYFALSGLGEPFYDELVRATLSNKATDRIIFQDRVSTLSVLESIPFYFDEERVLWQVGKAYRFRSGYMRPRYRGINGLLLRTRFDSRSLGRFEQKLVYVEMENSNFEIEIVREGFLNPLVYCGVRDGCSFGGNCRCENELDHLDRLIATRCFTPAIWVTDHIRYRGEDGMPRCWTFERDDPEGCYPFNAAISHEITLARHESRYGVMFLTINPGRLE